MRRTSIILILFFVGLVSCKQNKQEKEHITSEKLEFTKIIKDDYELYKPNKEAKAVLILFGGYPETAEDIKREFKILDIARKNNIAVLLSNFNQKLWPVEDEKTVGVMKDFYCEYLKTGDAVKSLSKIQREMLRRNRTVSPRIWAPFVISFQGRDFAP